MKNDKLMLCLTVLICSVYILGCVAYKTRSIPINEIVESPPSLKTKLEPVSAIGKETTTKFLSKDIQKEISIEGFRISKYRDKGLELMNIFKDDLDVSVAYCSFDYLKTKYGIITAMWHPMTNNEGGAYAYTVHEKSPPQGIGYRSESNAPYQMYWKVPFYSPVKGTLRDEKHKELLRDFQKDMAGQLSFSHTQNPNILSNFGKTKTEVKKNLQPLLGQPYVREYYSNDIVFFVRITNKGKEKIRLWPEKDAVIIDLVTNAQYSAYSADKLSNAVSFFNERWNDSYLNREEPFMGVIIGKDIIEQEKIKILYIFNDSAASKCDLRVNDILEEIDGKEVKDSYDLKQILVGKSPGEQLTILIDRDGKRIKKSIILEDRTNCKFPPPIKILSGGNVYPNVAYDGFLVFKGSAMIRNLVLGAELKLILPMIGVRFNAADIAIQSIDLNFIFRLTKE